jgi:hypothetical protein
VDPYQEADVQKLQKRITGNKEANAAAEEHQGLVSEAAYYRAEKRGFQPGGELEDWLLAESLLGSED